MKSLTELGPMPGPTVVLGVPEPVRLHRFLSPHYVSRLLRPRNKNSNKTEESHPIVVPGNAKGRFSGTLVLCLDGLLGSVRTQPFFQGVPRTLGVQHVFPY